MANNTPLRGQRWSVFSRVLAASLGGYVLSSSTMSLIALIYSTLPDSHPADGVLITTLLSFVLHAAIAIWVFSTRSALRAWLGIGGGVLLSGIGSLVLGCVQ